MRAKHSMQDYLKVVRDGTARHYEPGGPRKKVIIVGAGLAGLSAAQELLKAGHASLYHAWIQGAFESALRAAIAIHQAPN